MARLAEALAKGQAKAEEFLRHGVDTWVEEGRIDEARRDRLVASLDAPEVEGALFHAGAHFAISIPLRSPFGSIARFFYTFALRVKAELLGVLRRGSPRQARRSHTFLVMLFSLVPGFGRLAYFLSPALREERLFFFIPLDQASRKLPFRVYSRLHLDALFVYWSLGDEKEQRFQDRLSLRALAARLSGLRPWARPLMAFLAIDSVLLIVGAYMYVDSGRPVDPPIWLFRERGLMAMWDAGQLLAGAGLGLASYLLFWKYRTQPSRSEAAGIFLWGIGGIGLAVFAIDDYFTLHEDLGEFILDDLLYFVPVVTNVPSDMLVLSYAVAGLAVIIVFRSEVLSDRPSATLLQLAAFSSIVMVLVDALATTEALEALEFPAQTFACSLLLLAFGVRYLEVTSRVPQSAPSSVEVATR
jgi:hypothetical protein